MTPFSGNTITLPNPSDPTNPIVGIIAPNARIIIWDPETTVNVPPTMLLPVNRIDVDECATPALNDCARGSGGTGAITPIKQNTVCVNLVDQGYVCNCDIDDSVDPNDWIDANGNSVSVNVDATGNAVMIMSDGTTLQGDVREHTITVTMPDGSTNTATINKSDDGVTLTTTITWSDPSTGVWTRDINAVTVAPAVTTAAPVVTTAAPVATTAAVASNGNGVGSVVGDPHFRIDFENKKDVCFDFSAGEGVVMNLVNDKKSGLVINGE